MKNKITLSAHCLVLLASLMAGMTVWGILKWCVLFFVTHPDVAERTHTWDMGVLLSLFAGLRDAGLLPFMFPVVAAAHYAASLSYLVCRQAGEDDSHREIWVCLCSLTVMAITAAFVAGAIAANTIPPLTPVR